MHTLAQFCSYSKQNNLYTLKRLAGILNFHEYIYGELDPGISSIANHQGSGTTNNLNGYAN